MRQINEANKENFVVTQTFERDRFTWLAYLFLAFYGFFLNVLGPITPFLKSELNLSYTISSLHFTAFAVGILLVGLGGGRLIERVGRWRALWIGASGMSLSVLLLLAGKTPVLTIGASFLMGLVGSLILAIVPSALSDRHGEMRAVAFVEANLVTSLVVTSAPLMVGWFAHTIGNWRLALAIVAVAPILMYLGFRKISLPTTISTPQNQTQTRQPLPGLFWVFWATIILAVSAEFCIVFWSADYLENVLRLAKADATQAVSFFFVGMVLGRMAGSRLAQRFSAPHVVTASVLVASIGFLAFWQARIAALGLGGLLVIGLGIANLYPLLLSLTLGTASNNTVQASARATLASGVAILTLPLVLGRLADAVGIGLAFGVVMLLLAGIFLIIQIAGRVSPAQERMA